MSALSQLQAIDNAVSDKTLEINLFYLDIYIEGKPGTRIYKKAVDRINRNHQYAYEATKLIHQVTSLVMRNEYMPGEFLKVRKVVRKMARKHGVRLINQSGVDMLIRLNEKAIWDELREGILRDLARGEVTIEQIEAFMASQLVDLGSIALLS